MLVPTAEEVRPATSTDADWLRPRWFAVLLGVLVLASFPQVWLGWQTFVYRDYGLFAYPIADYFRESFWNGEWPLWNPLNNLGLPFLAQWNAQVLYPPALLYLLLPLSWSLGVFCLMHLFLGGLGLYFLAARWTRHPLAAAFAGIVFAFNGLMLNSLMWPGTIPGFGWMPWVVLLTERAWREGGRMVVIAALAGALQMLSGAVEVILMTWAILGALWLVAFARGVAARGSMLWRPAAVILLISGLCAAQLLPFLDLLSHSQRQQNFRAADWPMPLSGWGNFLVPLFHSHRSYHGAFQQTGQYWTSSYYVGVATLALAIVAAWRIRTWRVWLLAALTFACLVFAFGDANPLYRWLSEHVGVFNLMRFPVKFVILPVFALPLLAAYALAGSRGRREEADRRDVRTDPPPHVHPPQFCYGGRVGGYEMGLGRAWWFVWLAALALIALVLTFAWQSPLPHDDWPATWRNGLWRAIFFTAIIALLFVAERLTEKNIRRGLQLGLLLLVWLDLVRHAPQPQTVTREVFAPDAARQLPPPRLGESRALLSQAARATLGNWMFDDPADDYRRRRAALQANCNLLDGIPKADGFFPMYLRIHMPVFGLLYDETNAPPPALMDFLGVSQTTSPTNFFEWRSRDTFMPLLSGGQKPIFADNRTAVDALAGTHFNPRTEVYLPTEEARLVTASNAAVVTISNPRVTAQRITATVDAGAPALVIAAQTYYHVWKAYVDGKSVPLLRANYAFQALEVPPGRHEVMLAYEDRRFHWGVVISLAALVLCGGVWWRSGRAGSGTANTQRPKYPNTQAG